MKGRTGLGGIPRRSCDVIRWSSWTRIGSALRQTEGTVRFVSERRVCVHHRDGRGRSDVTWKTRRSKADAAAVMVVVVGEAQRCPRSNGWYGEEGLGVGKLPGCSGRLGVVCVGRISLDKVAG